MPGKGHIPELAERIIRTLKANTNRTVGGFGSNASPGMTRDRVAASRRGSSALPPTARSSKVDWFEVSDDSVNQFILTYRPIRDSWNVELEGIGLNDDPDAGDVEYQITNKTLTIEDPTDTFRGVATQGGPWKMRVQYDYLAGVPAQPSTVPASGNEASVIGGIGPNVMTLPAGVQAGSILVLCMFGQGTGANALVSVSGCGATWAKITGNTTNGGTEIWVGSNPTPGGTTVTATQTNTNFGVVTHVAEWTDMTGTGTGSSTSGTSATAASTSESAGAHTLAVGAIKWRSSSVATGHSDVPAPWTVQEEMADSGVAERYEVAFYTPNGGTVQDVINLDASYGWSASIAVLS